MTVDGQAALALGALVAEYSPSLGSLEKRTIHRIFNGDQIGPFPTTQAMTVRVDSILCRVSNVQMSFCQMLCMRDSSGGGAALLNELICLIASTNFTPRMTSAIQLKPKASATSLPP